MFFKVKEYNRSPRSGFFAKHQEWPKVGYLPYSRPKWLKAATQQSVARKAKKRSFGPWPKDRKNGSFWPPGGLTPLAGGLIPRYA